jgi:hypothetical protein
MLRDYKNKAILLDGARQLRRDRLGSIKIRTETGKYVLRSFPVPVSANLKKLGFRLLILICWPVAWLLIPFMYLWDGRRDWFGDVHHYYGVWPKAFRKGGPLGQNDDEGGA